MKAKGTIKHQKFTKGGKSYAEHSNTRPSILATSRGVLLKIHASIYLLESITWIPIQIIYNDGHFENYVTASTLILSLGRLWFHTDSEPGHPGKTLTMVPWFFNAEMCLNIVGHGSTVVWPWCVISPWPWYIANHNGNKVNYCFLPSQWKHITAQ